MMVSPEAPTVAGLGEISTEEGGPVTTTTSASPVNWFNVAVTVYDAVASAVTSPVEETVRPAGLLEDQVTGRSTNEIGRASCRERVKISVAAATRQKRKHPTTEQFGTAT